MPLLQLSAIGKIYVSDTNVSVGIRGVELSFERGEFVAVTGKSGSGKSTLLNVISGMDSYEEGELYIDGEPTSHFLESDWEEYREKYISFIFQDYNILESYTVLQNVELSLMHIEDKKERRERALELLRRVGLERQINQKGSKLSGGQKQRTVIARALAKDSPIILADEPTGNLDEATSREIIELLYEVSRDKLLILVTHNYDQVDGYATRHIRIYDGTVEFDRTAATARKGELYRSAPKGTVYAKEERGAQKKERSGRIKRTLRDGISLGAQVFLSRPKLAFFSCLLMLIGIFGMFFSTTLFLDSSLFEKNHMFTYSPGRVVVVRRDGGVPSGEEIAELAQKVGAVDYLECDYALEYFIGLEYYENHTDGWATHSGYYKVSNAEISGEYFGRLPEKSNEVFLSVPISEKVVYGELDGEEVEVIWTDPQLALTVCGVQYYYDNNITGSAHFSSEGIDFICAYLYAMRNSFELSITATKPFGFGVSIDSLDIAVDDALGDRIYINRDKYGSVVKNDYTTVRVIMTNQSTGEPVNAYIPTDALTFSKDEYTTISPQNSDAHVIIGAELIEKVFPELVSSIYKQFSLFFEDDRTAEAAIDALGDDGYIGVLSSTEVERRVDELLFFAVSVIVSFAVWGLAIIFFAFFISLCQSRSIVTFKNDIAIMRSMGVKADTIKVSMYVRTLISSVPAILALLGSAVLIFTSPSTNGLFTYLYGWQYALIIAGMLVIAFRVSAKQQARLFGESVKKTLGGGQKND